MVRTGLRISLPNDYGMVIKDRSSGSQKYEVVGGVYDPSYRGEICVNIHNYKDHQVMIKKGEKFAQMVVIPNLYTVIKEVDIISIDTPRGDGCLGSTDK
jgi:dUTPase